MPDIAHSIEQREISIALGVIVKKQRSTHPWASAIWKPVSVFLNPVAGKKWHEIMRDDEAIHYHADTVFLTLHRKETEALRANLMLKQPELYVVLQEDENPQSPFPYFVHTVTASSYDAQDMLDCGDDIVEKVAMPETVAALIQAFVEQHHVEEKFIKRQRDKVKLEEQKFGKTPIFSKESHH